MDDKRRDAERDKSSPEERRDPASTAEILADIDRSVEEYSFSIDDILAEFGVERAAEPEPEPEPAPEPEPQVPAYEMTSEELTDKLGEVAARMQEEREEQKLRETEEQLRTEQEERECAEAEREREKRERELELEIKRQVEFAADHVTEEQNEYPAEPDQRDEMGRIHIFEEEKTEETEKRRRFGGKKREDEEPAERRTVMKEAKAEEGKKVFGGKLEGIFGHDAEFRPKLQGGDVSEETFKQEHEEKLRKHRRKRPEPEESAAEPSETEPGIEPEEEVSLLVRELGRGRLRLLSAALLTVLLAFIGFAPYIGIDLPAIFTYVEKPYIYIFFNVLLQVGVMALCFETTAAGIRDIATLRPNMESVVVFANLTSLIYLFFVAIKPEWGGYYGFSTVGAASMLAAAYYSRKLTLAKLKSCRAAAGMSRPYIIAAEPELYDGEDTAVKYRAQKPIGFVSRLNSPDHARKVWRVTAPIVIIASIVLAAVASFGTGGGTRFVWCLAAISAAGAPLSLMMPFCLAFSRAAKHLYGLGEAITGWAAAESLSGITNVVVTDLDIFPPGNTALNGLKVYRGYPKDKVITYAASLINASGAAISRPFAEQHSNQTPEPLMKVQNFKFYENGGISGEIEGNMVLAGSATFMVRNNISIPKDVSGKTNVFIAVNLELVGVFAVSYNASGAVKRGLAMLTRQHLMPVFATRDFNITPSMIESNFSVSTDTIDFPKEAERIALSDPDRLFVGKISAVVSREGLKHYAECIACARNLRRAVRISTALTLVSAVLGMLIMFYLCFTQTPTVATPLNLLLYSILWLIPGFIASRWASA